jgi:UDP-3-O-[3-hydroxymyristoyl] glucosamine N-acyltransferase
LLTCTSHLSKYGIGLKIGSNSAIGDFAHFGAGVAIGDDVIMGSYISFHRKIIVLMIPQN